MAAADLGHLAVVKVLLEASARVDQQDRYSKQTNLGDPQGSFKEKEHHTALMRAALRKSERHADVLQEWAAAVANCGEQRTCALLANPIACAQCNPM